MPELCRKTKIELEPAYFLLVLELVFLTKVRVRILVGAYKHEL